MIRTGFFLLLFFIPFDLLAQAFTPNPDWRFENFNGQNRFVSREILDLALDKHGYVWTCSGGVQRFDGYKTVDFNSFDRSDGALRGNYTAVIADSTGRIWISSKGLCYYDDISGKFVYIKADDKHTISYIISFCLQKNYLWFICDFGLAKLDLRSLKISYTSLTDVPNPLCAYMVNENTMLVSSREKVYVYDIKTNTYTANFLTYQHALIKVFSVITKGRDIFLGTNNGLFKLDNFKDITLISRETSDVGISDMVFLPEDKEKKYLFLATEGKGIMVYNTILKRIEFTYTHDVNNIYSLPNNVVSKLYTDKNGRLWICSVSGITVLDVHNQQLKMRFLTKSNTDDLGVNKIERDKYNLAKVWMSSYNRGMICVNWQSKKIERIYSADPETRKIYDFVQLSKNRWLITTQKKIMEWNPERGVLSRIQLPVADSLGLSNNICRLILKDASTCYVTTNQGLFKYDLATHKITVAAESKAPRKEQEDVKYILLNGFFDKGKIWAASRGGLFSYDVNTGATFIYRGQGESGDYFLFDVTPASNNQIVCASGTGIAIFNTQTKKFKIVNTIANLYKPSNESIISINNLVWIGSEVGILNYDLNTAKSAKAENETSMMQLFPSSSFTAIDSDIVFGFRGGFAYFTPDKKSNLVPSNPVIEKVYVNNQAVLQQFPAQKNSGKLVLNHSDNSINIAFTAFLYTDPTHINFRYRLKGADSKWQYVVDQRSANYAQLEPGDYTFYVQCGNRNGIWNNHLASFDFVIQSPYWETWWFRTLVSAAIAFGLYSLYRYRIKNILAIQKIRERIASDFHDDIGSALSSISIFSEVADKQLKQQAPPEQTREIIARISLHSRAMLDSMDDIIWAVNPQNDHFNDLAVRMREFAIPLLEARNIQFEINIPEDILSTRIKMEARKNVFMIFKECINNILKHSCCTAMKVVVNKLNNQLELVISDNGKGFDINAPNARNGVKNMQKRAAEINGKIKVTTGFGAGTTTTLLINII